METITSNHTKRIKGHPYPAEFRQRVIADVKQGTLVPDAAQKYGVHFSTIYAWLKEAGVEWTRGKGGRKSGQSTKNSANQALVHKVISDIQKGKMREETRSLADDFNVTSAGKTQPDVELNYCPCCGTNIKAVRIAMETCQEAKA